ncbi:type I polyketide synthase [Rhodosalinus sp.]|uniref:type I polyketide synthase n=1 Tax=Rhodosalinus sp. TaxID=2047741 RepID=UPI00397E199B
MNRDDPRATEGETDIAIVGMAARLPGAAGLDGYWHLLREGRSAIRRLTDDELLAAGESPAAIRRKDYVPFAAPLDRFEQFDADFFGLSPKEAAIMDPQHRQFLEVAWEALEVAGHPPESVEGPVGVFAGCGMGSYFYFNVCSHPELLRDTGMFLLRHTGNDKDFLSTRLSHILDLRGPSLTLQTACSTSLVATHYAAQALLNGECDMALAGGVTIELPQGRGYLYKEGEILSPDGECHAFDHRAKGTVFGSGAGVVVLRRLADALADGDHIWAVIRGSAVNNDGSDKAGYLAPSVGGQAEAVADAQAIAGITADTVDYVECHGTGTYLGDPIEVAALTQAFRETTDATGYCRIGSVKTNIGHLDTAAGVASLIKASLALHHREIPPSLGFEKPNPAIDFENSPFRVNDRLTPFESAKGPRRAGVNSLGVGGTNAHVVLEEAPARAASEPSDWPFQLLTVSGHSKAALEANARRLAEHLRAHPEQDIADVAWTLKEGRRAFEHRRVVVAESHAEAAALLETGDRARVFTHRALRGTPQPVFMFPGGGAQYVGMARDLYETEPVFADWIDRGLDVLQPKLDYDVRALWLAEGAEAEPAARRLTTPSVQLPLIMIVEVALARLFESWGVAPAALIGHSMGENAAACVAGVMRFEDCIGLVHLRGRLMDEAERGGMLSVALPADELRARLGPDLDLAAENAPGLSVASGPQAALDRLQAELAKDGIEATRIAIDIAAHSRLLDPVLERFRDYLRSIPLSPPQIPVISNRTGTWLTAAEATDPDYWVAHLRGTVRFGAGMETLAEEPSRLFLEMGPGKALSALAKAQPGIEANRVVNALRHPEEAVPDDVHFIGTLGRLWALGARFDWGQIWGEARRNRVVLPTYAFQHAPYFIERAAPLAAAEETLPMRVEGVENWGWRLRWKPAYADCTLDVAAGETGPPRTWLIFADEAGLADRAAAKLRDGGHRVVSVRPGDAFARLGDQDYTLAPEQGREGYERLLADLLSRGLAPARIAHFWLVTEGEGFRPGSSFFHRVQEQGFWSLLFLGQVLAAETLPEPPHITVVTSGAAQVRDEALPHPAKATVAGPARVIPRELPGVTCATLDVALPQPVARKHRGAREAGMEALTLGVLEELLAKPSEHAAALRGARRFVQEAGREPLPKAEALPVQPGDTVLVTGGFGGIGLSVAERLARDFGCRFVLVSRSGLPPRANWAAELMRRAPADSVARRIRAVQALESAGAEVMVAEADVTNAEDMREVVEAATDRFGRIAGVIHAAGVVDDAPLMAKTLSSVEDVLAPKLHGTQVLDTLFPDGALDWMVLFSSTSTVTAPAGQVDYVAANEYLNAYARSRRGGRTRVLALNWGIWSEVGMAAEAVARRTGDLPEPPVVPLQAPLLDAATFDAGGHRLLTARWATANRWVLDEHRTRDGRALFPGTGYPELAAEALAAQGEDGPFEIRDLWFLRPLEVGDGQPREVRVRLRRDAAGYAMEVQAAAEVDGRRAWTRMAEATLALLPMAPPQPLDIAALEARCTRAMAEAAQGMPGAQEAHLTFGPRWRVLTRTALGDGEGVAHLRLPAAAAGDAGYALHPALMDIATGWAMELIAGYDGRELWVPLTYGRLRVHAPLPAAIVSWVRNAGDNRADAATARFDITLAAPDGTVCVEIEGFQIRRMEGGLAPSAAPTAREVEFDDEAGTEAPLSPAEERLAHNLSQGITPADGAEAFLRALGSDAPQVIVSSLPLDALVAQARVSDAATGSGARFDRPALEGDYVAPETPTEEVLAQFWSELLGVAQVGAEDSFFDLGGHSLIAVRLFAQIRKRFGVDLPISVLFEAPTIRACAALIDAETGGAGEDAGQTPKPATVRRFTHLVPMHEGEGGPKTPFFLVAGMFGNVLNLRHLAHLLGTDRPFYGLQARGLYGGAEPHRDLSEAAADMIAEIRQVQPHGPYLLGGFSGGGLTAYDMARQLTAAGEEVALVVLLDTPLPGRHDLSRRDRLLIHWQELQRHGLRYPAKWLAGKIRYKHAMRAKAEAGPSAEHAFHDAEIEAAFHDALSRYRMAPWDGRVALFRPALQPRWIVSGGRPVSEERAYLSPDNGWGAWVPGVEVHEVPGDHDSMVLEPNARVLAQRMRRAIEAAEREAAGMVTVRPAPRQAAE